MIDPDQEASCCCECGYSYETGPQPEIDGEPPDGWSCEHCIELRKLAEAGGCELRLDRDEDAPVLWAVWGCDPMTDDGEDIIGAGNTPAEAIDDARRQINEWNAKWVADQRRQMGVGR